MVGKQVKDFLAQDPEANIWSESIANGDLTKFHREALHNCTVRSASKYVYIPLDRATLVRGWYGLWYQGVRK